MADGPHDDVTSTLSELERKLIELERELLSVAGGPATDPAAVPALGEPAPPPAPAASSSLRAEIDELVIVRDRLQTLADELIERCDRIVGRLERADAGGGAPPASGADR